MTNWIDKGANAYCKLLELLLVALLAAMVAMVAMVFGNVVLRYAFNWKKKASSACRTGSWASAR